MGNWDRKAELTKKAQTHTEQMNRMYPNRIKKCIEHTKTYGMDAEKPNFTPRKTLPTPEVVYVNEDTVSALIHEASGKTAVLNYASYKNPGGMFINGSSAQEEALCHESFLYNVLVECKDYYEWNNKNKNKSLYMNRALYSPDVVFAKGNDGKLADVITCAAPNIATGKRYGRVSDTENETNLFSRIAFIRDVAETEGVETLITGAYGCGVFGQSPEMVADIQKRIFEHTSIKKIVYAVPGNDKNALVFKKEFGKEEA